MQQKQTVRMFLDHPVVVGGGHIIGIYPPANFAELISQVRRCESGHLKMVGVIMVVEALLDRIKEVGLGVRPLKKNRSTKKVRPATGALSPFNDRLVQFTRDRNLVVHNFLWKDSDGISKEILDRSCKLMDDLLHHFCEMHPDPDNPGAIIFRYLEIWNLDTPPPAHE